MENQILYLMFVFSFALAPSTRQNAGGVRYIYGSWDSIPIPEGMPFCRSCQSTCGSRRLPAYCNCDHLCVLSGDCCSDFPQQCPVQHERGLHLNVTYGTALDSCDLPDPRSYFIRPRLIASCSRDSSACELSHSDLFSFVPAQDEDTGLNFISLKCAMCNGVRRLRPWEIRFTGSADFGDTDPLDGLLGGHVSLQRDFQFSARPGGPVPQVCDADIGFIRVFCDESSEAQCNTCTMCNKTIKDQATSYVYVNCHLCSYSNWTLKDLCESKTNKYIYRRLIGYIRTDYEEGNRTIPVVPMGRLQLYILFDIRENQELSVSLTDLRPRDHFNCPPGYSKDGVYACRRDKHLIPLDKYKDITDQKHKSEDTFVGLYPYQNLENLLFQMKDNLQRSMQWINSSHVEVYLNETSATVVVELIVYSETKQELKNLIDWIKLNVTSEVQYIFSHNPRLIEGFNISLVVYSRSGTKNNTAPSILCYFMTDSNSNHSLLDWMNITANYNVARKTVFSCVDYLSNKAAEPSDQILYILEVLLLCTSVVALSITVGMWLAFRDFKCSGWRVQIIFMAAMMFSHLLLLLSSLPEPGSVACYIMGVFLHWFYLMMFAWMSVLAVDIARMILSSSRLQRIYVNNKDFAYYCVAAIGLPSLIVLVSVIVDQTNMRADLKPNYGGKRCWISGSYPLLIFFAVPVAGALLLNGVCFTVAIVLLCRTAYTCSRSADHRANALLYIKLFILMGLTWSLGFVSEFTGSLVVRYLFTILNASQGLLVAMAAMCSTHSRTILRNSLKQVKIKKQFFQITQNAMRKIVRT